MKLNKLFLVCALAFSTTACSALLDTPDLTAPDFTNEQAVTMVEGVVKAHAATQGVDAGPLQTVCNYDETEEGDEAYQCATLVKNSMVVLYATCTVQSCETTGYDKVEIE